MRRDVSQRTLAPALSSEKSVIVLPFANLSANPEDEYFSDGLTEELITDLSRVVDLRVVPSAAAFRLKNTAKDLVTIGREYNVRYVLEGRVRKAGQRARITAQLVDVWGDRPIWADKYPGELDRVFELQKRVSRAIAEALQMHIRPPSRAPKAEASEAYLKGLHFARQATAEGLHKALQYFQQAAEIDPAYVRALAAMAETYVTLTMAWETLPAHETMPKARTAAQRALDLDPNSAEAHTALALVSMYYDWDLARAEQAFKEALRLNPHSVEAHVWYGTLLIWLDTRYDEALLHLQHATQLDHVDPWLQVWGGWVYVFSRDHNRAIDHARQVIALHPLYGYAHYYLGCALLMTGQTTEGIASFRRAIELAWTNCASRTSVRSYSRGLKTRRKPRPWKSFTLAVANSVTP